MAPRGIALWGAGRLFDVLVRHGGFDPSNLALLIDTHLAKHMGERHGVRLAAPEELAAADPGIIIAMSRAFAGEIACEAKRFAPRADIIAFPDLMTRARTKRAA
jgi:hypothetical protein